MMEYYAAEPKNRIIKPFCVFRSCDTPYALWHISVMGKVRGHAWNISGIPSIYNVTLILSDVAVARLPVLTPVAVFR